MELDKYRDKIHEKTGWSHADLMYMNRNTLESILKQIAHKEKRNPKYNWAHVK
jgi:hypothetical protein